MVATTVSKENDFFDLRKVYFGGMKYMEKKKLFNEMLNECSTQSISFVDDDLLRCIYKADVEKIYNHFLYQRNESKIYIFSNECIVLDRIIRLFDATAEKNLNIVYEACCLALHKSNRDNQNGSSVILMNFCDEYIRVNKSQKLFYLQFVAYLALLVNRHLFPFITFVFIMNRKLRKNETTKEINSTIAKDENGNYVSMMTTTTTTTTTTAIEATDVIKRICDNDKSDDGVYEQKKFIEISMEDALVVEDKYLKQFNILKILLHYISYTDVIIDTYDMHKIKLLLLKTHLSNIVY